MEGLSGTQVQRRPDRHRTTWRPTALPLAQGGTDGLSAAARSTPRASPSSTGLQAVLGAGVTSFDAGDIILGGDGSDMIMGNAGDDIIDGDKWLDVRIGVYAATSAPTAARSRSLDYTTA